MEVSQHMIKQLKRLIRPRTKKNWMWYADVPPPDGSARWKKSKRKTKTKYKL